MSLKQFFCILLPLLLLAGCATPRQPDTPTGQDKHAVIIALDKNSEPQAGFDPAYGWGAGEHVHEPLIQSTLTVTTTDLQIGYDLATGMQTSEDGLLWTVTIRDDVLFSDGMPLTASDVAFTYNTVKELSTVNDFTMLDYAEAADSHTVLFHMNRADSIWPYSMAVVGIIPEHAYSPGYGQNPIGSGRYLLTQWDRGEKLILEANPLYYGEQPTMQAVTILFMEESAAFAAVQAGQVDLAYTAASYAPQSINGYGLLAVESVDNRGFNLPAVPWDGAVGNDFTSDPAVRQAINTGIDRDLLIEQVLDGYGTPAYSVCDKLPWHSETNYVAYDPDAARSLLEEAGWLPAADGIRERDGVRAALNFLYPAGDSVRQALAAALCNQLRELGIDATFEGVGWDVAYDRAQWEPLIWGWGAHTPMELYNIYHTAPGEPYARYSPYANETVDAYMDAALAQQDLARSYELWQLAQWDGEGGAAADLPWIWLVNVDHLYWQRDGLQVAAQKLHPHGHGWSIVNNVDQWHWL